MAAPKKLPPVKTPAAKKLTPAERATEAVETRKRVIARLVKKREGLVAETAAVDVELTQERARLAYAEQHPDLPRGDV